VTRGNFKIVPPHYYIGEAWAGLARRRGDQRILDYFQYEERWYAGFVRFSPAANATPEAGATW